jgi:hypothetical protein
MFPVLALVAFQTTDSVSEGIRWTLLAYLPPTVFPLIYAKIRAVLLSRDGKRRKISRSLVREDPAQLFIMTVLFGVPSSLIIYLLNGPDNLFIIIIGLTAIMLAISLLNLKYRASFHLSMVTGMLTALWFVFGTVAFIGLLLVPVLGFSRYTLREHTLGQIITGVLVGSVVGSVVFLYMGLPV